MPRALPEAVRSIALGGREIAYRLRRSRRRSIGLTIDRQGLRVGAPLSTGIGDIETLIRRHGNWVLGKLDSWRERPPAPALAVADGTTISAFGAALTLAIRPARRSGWRIVGDSLHLAVSAARSPAEALAAALRAHARSVLAGRLAVYAGRLGVPTPPLRLSSARTRWGSCSPRGVSLNWRLVFLPLPVADYVVAHEVAHLREMNHSPRFWSVVEQLCPDWRARRNELHRLGPAIPQL
ncbi:MAG: M48 family metallopeptidase [Betaproteobacteria bacterium]|nr:M48 family metallopeptidase [Betaproteobacteria bacterium]